MDRFPNSGWRRGFVAAAIAACLEAVCLPAFQRLLSDPDPILIEGKKASRMVVTQVRPEYPALAKVNYIQGQVRLQVFVNPEGRVHEAHVLEGHPFLAAPALKAIQHWAYRPLMTRSGPVAFLTYVEMKFALLHPKKLDQMPNQPERDLTRQIRPPEILDKPAGTRSSASVRVRILLSDKGQLLDWQPIEGTPAYFKAARRTLDHWTFRPARWGSLSVPWYLEIDVPVETETGVAGAGDPNGQ